MSQEENQKRSQAKVQQIINLMQILQVTVEPRERITQDGFIERLVYWIDHEKYESVDPAKTAEDLPKEEEVQLEQKDVESAD